MSSKLYLTSSSTGVALDEIVLSEPTAILAPLIAFAVAYVLFYEGMLFKIGSEGKFWSTIRSALPMLDDEN